MRNRSRLLVALPLTVAAMAPSGAIARDVFQCERDGQVTFSDEPCTSSDGVETRRREYDISNTGVGGYSAQSNYGWVLSEKRRRQDRRYAERRARERRHSPVLGYGDKTRIRELQMEKGQLQDDLRRVGSYGLGSLGKADAIRSRMRSVDRQIEQIRARPTGH